MKQSVASIYASMTKEAFVMSFGDCFLAIGILFYIGTFLLIFASPPGGGVKVVEGSH
jgi:hypothetical protein